MGSVELYRDGLGSVDVGSAQDAWLEIVTDAGDVAGRLRPMFRAMTVTDGNVAQALRLWEKCTGQRVVLRAIETRTCADCGATDDAAEQCYCSEESRI